MIIFLKPNLSLAKEKEFRQFLASKKIVYFGESGSFSHIAADKFFKGINNMKAANTLEKVFEEINKDDRCFGVVPWENSTTGSITETFDLLLRNKLSIVGEVFLRIHHHLLGIKKVNLDEINLCYSHKQAIMQCQQFFAKHPNMKVVETNDTATACKIVSNIQSVNNAAISSLKAAENNQLVILKSRVEDNPNNYTRFAVVGKNANNKGNKISLVFRIKHIPGSLFKALKPYADFSLNLTKIESRPIWGKFWEYLFFLDFEVNKENEILRVLNEMKKQTQLLTVLGRYNKGEIYET